MPDEMNKRRIAVPYTRGGEKESCVSPSLSCGGVNDL